MHIPRRPHPFEAPERDVTKEHVYWSRRSAAKGAVTLAATFAVGGTGCTATRTDTANNNGNRSIQKEHFSPLRNQTFDLGDDVTPPNAVSQWNNYFEFGSNKNIWKDAQSLSIEPWQIRIDGLVEKPVSIDLNELLKKMPLEERVYRHRCIEKWAFVAPWSGFPLRALVNYIQPKASAHYVRMESFLNPFLAPGQFKFWYPWPYYEALSIEEATHELAFMASGVYGKPLPKQNGAPLRLVVPWKYGYKSIKAVQRITFTAQQPGGFWSDARPNNFGFWANVKPDVDHPYARQDLEFLLGTEKTRETEPFNGYEQFVSILYDGQKDTQILT